MSKAVEIRETDSGREVARWKGADGLSHTDTSYPSGTIVETIVYPAEDKDGFKRLYYIGDNPATEAKKRAVRDADGGRENAS